MQTTTDFNPAVANGKTHQPEQLNINLYGFTLGLDPLREVVSHA